MVASSVIVYIMILLVWYQFKHFMADYPMQTPWMLGKFKPNAFGYGSLKEKLLDGWVAPLLLHAGVHGAWTVATTFIVGASHLWWLGVVDFCVHFTMDRIKAGPILGRFKALSANEFKKVLDTALHAEDEEARKAASKRLNGNVYFWWSLGLDQAVHHLTHYVVIFYLVSDRFLW